MNSMRLLRGYLILLAALCVGNDALAHGHSHGRSRAFVGFGLGVVAAPAFAHYYPSPFYYPYYSTAAIDRSPLVYIEQNPPPVEAPQPIQPAPSSYWYYCAAAKAYYPYVRACPSGWQKVLPQTPSAE